MSIAIECQKRPEGAKPRALRREGLLPVSLYGHKGAESMSLTVATKTAETLLKNASINNTLVDVSVPDASWKGKALIREVQSHPWRRTLYHLSFFAVGGQDSVEVVVPINLVGEAAGVKDGGILDQIMTETTVKCAPDSIPESIEIDVSEMEVGTTLHVDEISVPSGVEIMDEARRTVLSIVTPTVPDVEETEETSEIGALLEDASEEEAAAEGEDAEAQDAGE
ncbi:MAG: 50S ribosomal protein L25/general stress protein Ctc [Jaaginema sp. PMC 1079.18]|nr:50S ribosomal protein L25/general stress protein Ctc [Jaaginema sp. PMC 1080.18]MEC4851362.1 50S ribosomal protein L25/general stress protein Ctc [Jaaginema sp. PMC 1079.18]MEC4865368.1 50S ribosomal protein L25/general stress protein Ctc [Jaaginema sp. PMC 1078.18]